MWRLHHLGKGVLKPGGGGKRAEKCKSQKEKKAGGTKIRRMGGGEIAQNTPGGKEESHENTCGKEVERVQMQAK